MGDRFILSYYNIFHYVKELKNFFRLRDQRNICLSSMSNLINWKEYMWSTKLVHLSLEYETFDLKHSIDFNLSIHVVTQLR